MTFAQGYEQAKNLLDRVSKEMKRKKNIRFDFTYVLENKKEQIRQEMEGNVTLAGDQYRLSFLEAIQLFDGTKTYTIVPENKEITISYPEEEEDVSISPSKLLSFYEVGYGYEWDIQQRVMGRNIQFIKLLPTETSEEVKYLLLGIDVDRLQVYRLIEVGINQTLTTLTLKSQEFNITLPEDYFEFNAAEYPNYYINE
jgi:outer membrane lipoprotein-sorting protein